jgi:hypothetical protein
VREKSWFRLIRGSNSALVVGVVVFSLFSARGMAVGLDPEGWLQPEHLEAIGCAEPLDGV